MRTSSWLPSSTGTETPPQDPYCACGPDLDLLRPDICGIAQLVGSLWIPRNKRSRSTCIDSGHARASPRLMTCESLHEIFRCGLCHSQSASRMLS